MPRMPLVRTQSAWVLPHGEQSEETGTLVNYIKKLGVAVEEYNLDNSDDEEEDDDEASNAGGLVSAEAEEANGDDEMN